jgi:type 1 fimbria pilin
MTKNKALRLLMATAAVLMGLALANASDSETYTVTVSGVESVRIDTPGEPNSLTVDYYTSNQCSTVASDRFCAWYPTISYSTNYTTNRKLVASVSNVSSGLSVILEKQSAYPDPFVPGWGSGITPGSWAPTFSGTSLTLSATDQDIVVGIQSGSYAIAPIIKLKFASDPAPGTYSATVTFTIMAQ